MVESSYPQEMSNNSATMENVNSSGNNFDENFPVIFYSSEIVNEQLDIQHNIVQNTNINKWLALVDVNNNLQDVLLVNKVMNSGHYNRWKCRIPVKSVWNIQWMEKELLNYHDAEVTEWLKFGFPISREMPSSKIMPAAANHLGATMFPVHVENYIKQELEYKALMGPFTIPPFLEIGISPISTRPKKDSRSRRIILDLSFPFGNSVNDGIQKDMYCGAPIKLKYPTIDSLAKRIMELKNSSNEKILLWKWDIERAFCWVPLCPSSYRYIGIRWENLIWFDKFVPMGLRTASYIFQRISNSIVFIHSNNGFWSIAYLDDYGSAEIESIVWQSYEKLSLIFQATGIQEAKDKAVSPTTRMDFLGNTLDTEKLTIEVSENRLLELNQLLKQWKNKKRCNKKQIQSLIGKLSFVTNCVKAGRVFLSRLIS